MTVSLESFFLLIICVALSQPALIRGPVQEELDIYNDQIRIVRTLLSAECPTFAQSRREQPSKVSQANLEVQKLYYESLLTSLIRCRERNANNGTGAQQQTTGDDVTCHMSEVAG